MSKRKLHSSHCPAVLMRCSRICRRFAPCRTFHAVDFVHAVDFARLSSFGAPPCRNSKFVVKSRRENQTLGVFFDNFNY